MFKQGNLIVRISPSIYDKYEIVLNITLSQNLFVLILSRSKVWEVKGGNLRRRFGSSVFLKKNEIIQL